MEDQKQRDADRAADKAARDKQQECQKDQLQKPDQLSSSFDNLSAAIEKLLVQMSATDNGNNANNNNAVTTGASAANDQPSPPPGLQPDNTQSTDQTTPSTPQMNTGNCLPFITPDDGSFFKAHCPNHALQMPPDAPAMHFGNDQHPNGRLVTVDSVSNNSCGRAASVHSLHGGSELVCVHNLCAPLPSDMPPEGIQDFSSKVAHNVLDNSWRQSNSSYAFSSNNAVKTNLFLQQLKDLALDSESVQAVKLFCDTVSGALNCASAQAQKDILPPLLEVCRRAQFSELFIPGTHHPHFDGCTAQFTQVSRCLL